MPVMHPSSRVVVCLALVLATAVGCGGDDNDDGGGDFTISPGRTTVADEPSTTRFEATLEAVGSADQAGVSLGADLAVEGSTLRVTYRVENAGERPVAVADAVAVPQGATHGPGPTGAWVTASTEGVVTIGKWPIAIPSESGDRGEPLSLYLVRVEAGATVEGTIELDWPLEPNHPYLPGDQLPAALPDPVETLRLCLGVNSLSPEVERARVVEGDGHSWLAVSMDQLVATPPLCTEPVSVG